MLPGLWECIELLGGRQLWPLLDTMAEPKYVPDQTFF